jgi:hypothetical protein
VNGRLAVTGGDAIEFATGQVSRIDLALKGKPGLSDTQLPVTGTLTFWRKDPKNATTAVAMLAGRFGLAALALALAGRFAAQRRWPTTAGTLPSDSATFGALLLGTILLVGALCFLPALALGPIAEALQH